MNLFSHTLALGLARLRQFNPRVYCVTNSISMDFVYNTLLALGAKPLMSQAEEEAGDYCAAAHALIINTAAPTPSSAKAMLKAATEAKSRGLPWVLDPRGYGISTVRDDLIYELLDQSPCILRTKPPEMVALAVKIGYVARGVDGGRTAEEAVEAARYLARQIKTVAIMTGTTDIITDYDRVLRLTNGHKIMGQVSGMGSGLAGVLAAFAGVEDDKTLAAAMAVGVYNIIAEITAGEIEGPLAFRSAFVDKLQLVDANNAMRRLKVL